MENFKLQEVKIEPTIFQNETEKELYEEMMKEGDITLKGYFKLMKEVDPCFDDMQYAHWLKKLNNKELGEVINFTKWLACFAEYEQQNRTAVIEKEREEQRKKEKIEYILKTKKALNISDDTVDLNKITEKELDILVDHYERREGRKQ